MPDLGLVLEVEQIGEDFSSVSTESDSGVTNSAPPSVTMARTDAPRSFKRRTRSRLL